MSINIHNKDFNLEEAAEYMLKTIESVDKNRKGKELDDLFLTEFGIEEAATTSALL